MSLCFGNDFNGGQASGGGGACCDTFDSIYVNNLADVGSLNVRETATFKDVSFAGDDGNAGDVMTTNGAGVLTLSPYISSVSNGFIRGNTPTTIPTIPIFPTFSQLSGPLSFILPFAYYVPQGSAGFAVNNAGKYQITARLTGVLDNTGKVSITILKNGARTFEHNEALQETTGSSALISLQTTDYFTAAGGDNFAIGITSRDGLVNSGQYSSWCMHVIQYA